MDEDERRYDGALPREPIDRLIGPFERFLHVEAASGLVLLACSIVALALANSPWAAGYSAFWETKLTFALGSAQLSHSLKHWVNDGLMAIFFFVIGLEVKRELVLGELRDPRRAALPIFAAVGGMLAPATIYLALQAGEPGERGWGIPMATDIAFVVGGLAFLGSRVPPSLRVLLLSLAIADDIGAIVVIAIGYTDEIHLGPLGVALLGIGATLVLSRLGVRSFGVYGLLGLVVWGGLHESGVHATLAGVVLGLMTPARPYVSQGRFAVLLARASELFHSGNWEEAERRAARVQDLRRATRETIPPLEYLEGILHSWVAFTIMPVFALANAGVAIELSDFGDPIAQAVAAGLVVGKPVGVLTLCWLATRIGLAELPEGVDWTLLAGAGALAGIGFTMALFIAGLALEGPALDAAKIGTLAGSAVAGGLGMGVMSSRLPRDGGTGDRNGEA